MPLLLADLDNTLVDRIGAFRSWAWSFVKRHRLGEGSVDWLIEHDFDGVESRERFFARVLERWALPFTVAELVASYPEDVNRHLPPVHAETLAALDDLRRAGWKIAVVTNGSPSQQFAKMESTGILPLLDSWCISEEVGVRKPDPAIFELAAQQCGTVLRDGWMVGDSAEADIAGGRAAGLFTAWVRLGREWGSTEFEPDLTVDTFADAVGAIRRSATRSPS